MPTYFCQDLERLMCKLWWRGSPQKERGIHWLSWHNMSKKKSMGGIGFRNVRDFNVALLCSQGWRLLRYPEKLVSRVFKARYYPTGSFFSAKLGYNPSYIWRSIVGSQSLLKKGSGCRVGNGQTINILEDPWLPVEDNAYIHTRSETLQGHVVSSLMESTHIRWEEDLILDVFERRDANIILSIPLNNDGKDSWYQRREKLGDYSVKSAYLMLQEDIRNHSSNANSGFWRKLWNLKIPPKLKNFLWRTTSNCIPTKDLLRQKWVQVNAECPVCNTSDDSILHNHVLCPFAVSSWMKLHISSICGEFKNFNEWLNQVFQQHLNEDIHIIVMVCWMLWKNRNSLMWNQRSSEPFEVVESAISEVFKTKPLTTLWVTWLRKMVKNTATHHCLIVLRSILMQPFSKNQTATTMLLLFEITHDG